MKIEIPENPENEALKRFEDHLLARNRKSAGRYLRVARLFQEANPGEEEPFEARHVNRFLADLRRAGAGGQTLRWNYYVVKSFFRALGRPWPFQQGEAPKAEENEDVPVYSPKEMAALEEAAKSHGNKETPGRPLMLDEKHGRIGRNRYCVQWCF